MSLGEQGAKIATSVVDSLKSQPLSIALVVVNCLFLGAGVWFMHDLNQSTRERSERVGKTVDQILQRCIPGEKT